MHYTIKSISIWSALKFGGVIGVVLGFFPGLTLGLTLRSLVRTLRGWLESWFSLDIPIMGSISLLDAVRLGDFLTRLRTWDDRGWLMVLFLTLLAMVVGGILLAFFSALGAFVFNLVSAFSGGLIVEAETLDGSLAPPGRTPEYFVESPGATLPAMQQQERSLYSPSSGDRVIGHLVDPITQQSWPVSQGETRIGSSPDNQIVLGGLAATHALIRWENGRFILYDYSGGQTWVNGRSLVGPNMLKPGFQIRLGAQEFLFQI